MKNEQNLERPSVSSCCHQKKSSNQPVPPFSENEPATCCRIRRPESTPKNRTDLLVNGYERLEPYLLVVSGLSLLAGFFHWTEDVLPFDAAWIAIAISGTPIFIRALKVLFWHRRISVDVLISTAILATIVAERFFSGKDGHHSYLFAGGEVAFIMALGHQLEEWTVTRARAGIENLIRMTPQTARRVEKDAERDISASEVRQGDLLKVLPGETIPVDGDILSGGTSIDQSLITGESMPVDKFEGDPVFGGTINRFGSFTMKATRVGKDSSLDRMIRLVRQAETKKAPMERIADRWASRLVPIALLTSVVVGLASYALLGQAEESLRRAVTILVVFCPCSLVLATPTAIIAAIGNASHHGILIRSGESLERFAKVDVLAFDKTGTLTVGQPQVTAIQSFESDYDSNGLLALAASVETLSEHPIATSIVKAATLKGVELSQTSDFEMFQGQGIAVKLAGVAQEGRILVGNERLLSRFDIVPDDFQKSQAENHFALGETVVWIAVDRPDSKRILGLISIADALRETSRSAIGQLRHHGIEVMLLTGDNERAARNIAEQSGIFRVESNLLPEGKVQVIEELTRNGSRVGMVGDGLNDAPALKTAEVGVAMGKIGSDLTIDAADIVLLGDDITRFPFLVRLARKTKQTIVGNIGLSMGINAVAVILASTGIMGPVVGALVHNAGSLFVVLNASLLLNVKR